MTGCGGTCASDRYPTTQSGLMAWTVEHFGLFRCLFCAQPQRSLPALIDHFAAQHGRVVSA